MSPKRAYLFAVSVPWHLAVLAAALVTGLTSEVSAQSKGPGQVSPGGVVTADTPAGPVPADPANKSGVVQAGCTSCGGGALLDVPPDGFGPGPGPFVPGDCPTCGCSGGCCYPGRKPCDCDCDGSMWTKCLSGMYHAICCPDPCYEPTWIALANAALFVDPARPVTQMMIRGDFGWDLQFPDRSEYFWARAGGFKDVFGNMSTGKGPRPPSNPTTMTPLAGFGENRINYREGSLYTEGALDRIGVFFVLPYRNIDPETYGRASGIGDIQIGTKTLLMDSELMQFTLQFKVFVPSGNFGKGLGTGHASLEPSALAALKLTPVTYLQYQLAYWFPLGGDNDAQGPVFHYHLSLNQLLCACGHLKPIELIGTLEVGGYEFTGGAYTDPVTGLLLQSRNVGNIFNAGPGLRLNICNKIDFGVGMQFALTENHLAEELLRAEFRWRF